MKNKATLFTLSEKKLIEEAIARAEKRTSGELVVQVVQSSSEYWWVVWAWALIGGAMASTVVAILDWRGQPMPFFVILRWQLLGMAIGSVLSRLKIVRRWSLPSGLASRRVHRECLANFLACGLHKTREHTGILIYLSELERRVEILADHGIHLKSGTAFWKERVDEIIAGLSQGQATTALCQTIDRIGEHLSQHFPPRPGDRNELPNEVRLGPKDMKNEDDSK